MAKTHQLGFSPFLVGFLLVLLVSDLACVQGSSCNVVTYKENTLCKDCYRFCETQVLAFQIQTFDRAVCDGWDENIGATTLCVCCLWQ
ncbi:hypothetical protein MKW92_012538 [Papaver armeniacum]|nr:hypothetical protein MKW92_012538 [Papaver armeniacum]